MKHLSEDQKKELRSRLEEKLARLTSYRQSVRDENPANDPDRLENNESGDEAMEAYEMLESEALQGESTSIIHEIRAALKRMDEGVYGVDEKTGQPIPYERLLLFPEARTGAEPESH